MTEKLKFNYEGKESMMYEYNPKDMTYTLYEDHNGIWVALHQGNANDTIEYLIKLLRER